MVFVARPETPDQAETANGAEIDWPPLPNRAAVACRDLAQGFIRFWMWWALAIQDMRLRYRGSALGPFWLTLSMLMLAVGMGVIYSRLFHTDTRSYLPYLTMGLIIWQFISSMTTEGCQTFLLNEGVIQQVPIPFSIHVYRVVCRNLIVMAHNLLIVPIGLIVFQIPVGWSLVELVPAVAMLAINGVWVSLFLGMLSARFRDVAPIVASVLQIAFFMTPVMWQVDALGPHRWMGELNPLFAVIDVMRAPLLGVPVAPYSWPLLFGFTVIGWAATFALFARFRHRIAYWI